MSRRQNHFLGALVLAIALGGFGSWATGCAGSGNFEAKESPQLPATIAGLRAAIEVERSKLKALVGEPVNSPEPTNADALIAIAERLSRLQAALEELERAGGDEATEP